MPGRSQKKIDKAHALNKRVRKEKARLRRRTKKHKHRVWFVERVYLSLETIKKLQEEAKKRGVSIQAVARLALRRAVEKENGIQTQSNFEVDESTK